MSKKLWFIFEDDHHRGPFDREQMVEKITRGELLESGLVWTEGLAAWVSADSLDDFAPLFCPPPLPPLPVIVEEVGLLPPLPQEVDEIEEMPPPLPPLPQEYNEVEAEPEPVPEPPVVDSPRILDDLEQLPDVDESLHRRWKIPAMVVTVLIVLVTVWLFAPASFVVPGFHELRQSEAEQMRRFVESPLDMTTPFKLSLTRDLRSIVLGTPLKDEFQVYLIMHSIPGEILSEGAVVLESRARLRGHQAHFRELEIIKGRGFVPGRYEVKVVAIQTGLGARWRQWRSGERLSFEWLTEQRFIRGSAEEFEQELEQLRAEARELELAHVRQRLESYQTMGSLLQRIFQIYSEVMEQIRTPEHIDRFEARYAQEVGPLLQGLIIESIEKVNELREQGNVEEARSYELFVNYGRSVGSMVSDIVTTARGSRQFNRQARERQVRLFKNRHDELLEELQIRLNYLTRELDGKAE
jgi:hypothetical protein